MHPRRLAITALPLLTLTACTGDDSEAPQARKATMAELCAKNAQEDTEGNLDTACAGIDALRRAQLRLHHALPARVHAGQRRWGGRRTADQRPGR